MPDCGASALTYEKQESTDRLRMCGAAALCMIYRSFGATCTQHEVWREIFRPDAQGNFCAHSHLLCADALERGYAALTLQVRTPWRALKLAATHGMRAIVNYRMSLRSRSGHFAVIVRVEDNDIVLHDPQIGPEQRIAQPEFLKLWRPGLGNSEVPGNILVAFSTGPRQESACGRCGTESPRNIPCPACQRAIPLEPAAILGCPVNACGERTWATVFCPFCDAALSELGT